MLPSTNSVVTVHWLVV